MSNIQQSGSSVTQDRSARRLALEPFTSEKWDGGTAVDGWLKALRAEEEEKERLKREAKSPERLQGLVRNGDFHPKALKQIAELERIRRADPVEAVRIHTQYMVLAQMRGLDTDCEIVEVIDSPTFNKTRAAKWLKQYRPVVDGTNPSFGSIRRTAQQIEREEAKAVCLQRLRDGAHPKDLGKGKGPGRSSNAWNQGVMLAIEEYRREIGEQAYLEHHDGP